ncbi:MAG TPA: YXWGXW repeat-containing protein, partial [Gemmatimonadaceae bacterium]|nr:YXWGXW repeat-containing protein [Gemmatimonadaceae bacterium]
MSGVKRSEGLRGGQVDLCTTERHDQCALSARTDVMIERMKHRLTRAALAATVVIVAACASGPRGERVYVREAPPAERVEVISRSPGPGYVWVAGHWNWDTRQYVWISGRW